MPSDDDWAGVGESFAEDLERMLWKDDRGAEVGAGGWVRWVDGEEPGPV